MAVCIMCGKNISTRSVTVSCHTCKSSIHASCAKLTKEEAEFFNEENAVWRCNVCSEKRRSSMRLEQKCETGELTIVDIKCMLDQILEKQDKIENNVNVSLNSQFDELKEINKKLSEQSERLENALQCITHLQVENSQLRKEIKRLYEKNEDLEQYSRANTIEINGFPEDKNESVCEIVKSIGAAIKVPITDEMIDACHRLRRRPGFKGPRGIIVKFVRRFTKDEFLKGRKVYRDLSTRHLDRTDDVPIYIKESLSPGRRKLFFNTRMANKQLKYEFVWTKNGNVLMRKNQDSAIISIRNEEDLAELLGKQTGPPVSRPSSE